MSFTFWISFAQFILLIVALGIGGFASPSDNPSLGPPASTLILLGAKDSPLMRQGQVWRFITPIFLHAGIIHLVFNLFAQLRFGLMMERKWGIPKYVLLYFISGIGASLMSCLLRPNYISVGASGAIMGLMGGYLAEIILTWHKTEQQTRKTNLIQMLITIAVIMLLSAIPYIDIGAHFGGLLVGFLMGGVYFAAEFNNPNVRRFVPVLAIAAVVIFFVVGFACFYTVMNIPSS